VALRWTSALSLGVPELDAAHQELFRRFDRLLDAMLQNERGEALQLIAFLRDYVVNHFGAEERLMQELQYPEMQHHVEEHRAFAAALKEIDASFLEEGPTAMLVLQLEERAVNWLRDHVYFTDVSLGRFVLSRRPTVARPA
jgi:hemerythrin